MSKVYWKRLRIILQIVKTYIQRWDLKLKDHLTTPQYECVIAVLDAVIICLGNLPEDTPIT